MAHRSRGQLSLGDGLLHSKAGANARLDRIDGLLDWSAFENCVSVVYAARKGHPSYPPLMMFKCLLLQQWYGLSDPGLEEALCDRLSFRRFVGLALGEAAPDHSTISRFRKQLARHDPSGSLFEELHRQLDDKGLIVRQGTLIDASLVAAQASTVRLASHFSARSRSAPETRRSRLLIASATSQPPFFARSNQ